MSITKFAVKYPVSVLMITLGVCLLGIISYNKLGTDLFPDLKNPALYIELEAGERPPEEIEKQFVERIESMAARQEGVKQVSSSSKVGSASITVEYNWDQDMDAAFLDLQRSMSALGQDDEITSLNVSRYDANATPGDDYRHAAPGNQRYERTAEDCGKLHAQRVRAPGRSGGHPT